MSIDCFKKSGLTNSKGKTLQSIYESRVEGKELTTQEQREIATAVALEFHKELHNASEALRKKALGDKYKPTKYESPDKSAEIKAVREKYEAKKAAESQAIPLQKTEESKAEPLPKEPEEAKKEEKEIGKISKSGKAAADWIRTLRPPTNSAQSNILGLPLAIYDSLIVAVANLVEDGANIAQAVSDAIKQLKAEGKITDADLKDFNQKEFTEHLKERQRVGEYVSGVLSEFPDATASEIMDAIEEDAPQFIKGEKRAAIEAAVRAVVEPKVEVKAETEFKGEPKQYGENSFLYLGTKKERISGLMRHIKAAKGISKEAKERFEDKLNYKVANNEEARNIANALIKELGDIDALTVARGVDLHPSVRSAIYAGLIDNAFAREVEAKKANDEDAAMDAARQWAELSIEYDDKLTEGGQFTSYANKKERNVEKVGIKRLMTSLTRHLKICRVELIPHCHLRRKY